MLQTAQLLEDKQYLNIVEEEQDTSSNNTQESEEEGVIYYPIDNELFKKVSPFYYKDRIRLSFAVSPTYKTHYVMIKGLIEFHRTKDFVFTYDISQGSVETDIRLDQFEDLQSFLSKVLVWLKQENQFRTALKIALDFERRYQLERDSVYEIMKRTVSAAVVS